MVDSEEIFNRMIEETARQDLSGWDFSYISDTGRVSSEPLPWSYTSRILWEIPNCYALLDMGTGGGEFLALLGPLPKKTCVTEGYAPNVPIAKKRLEPLGIKVYQIYRDERLPFVNDAFDLIINRHESFDSTEVYRTLASGGKFITQQVGGINDIELNKRLEAPLNKYSGRWNLANAVDQLESAGFEITYQDEAFPYTRFYDIGAVIYYLKYVEWQIPNFTITRYLEKLKDLHHEIISKGFIEIKSHRFFIEAMKI